MRNISCTWKKGKVLQGRMTMFGCWWWKWTVSTELTMSVTCLNPIQCYQKLSSSILKVEEQEQGSVVSLSILYSIYSMYSIIYSILKVEEQEQGSVVSLSKEEQQRDRRAKMVKRGVFERGKLQELYLGRRKELEAAQLRVKEELKVERETRWERINIKNSTQIIIQCQ